MVQKFRVPRKDPSVAALPQDDSKWRLVREDQGPPLPRWVRPFLVGADVPDGPCGGSKPPPYGGIGGHIS